MTNAMSGMRRNLLAIVFALLAASRSAESATWVQQGTPGDLPATAQSTGGLGDLEAIIGTLPVAFNSVHMYAIKVTDFAIFSATAANAGTSVDFDTMLFLFDESGKGVYFNDDSQPDLADVRSTLPPNDPNGPTANGRYYLAITGYGRFPHSSGGSIFPENYVFEDVHGPTGPGGASAIAQWIGDDLSIDGPYRIDLTGAGFAETPESATFGISGIALLAIAGCMHRRRRSGVSTNADASASTF